MSARVTIPRRSGQRLKLSIAFVSCSLSAVVGCMLPVVFSQTQPVSGLDYQDRGSYFEGIKSGPVSGYDIELISSAIDYGAGMENIPSSLNLYFFVDRPEEISVTVREIDNRNFYWLDRVRPKSPWLPGRANTFGWDTTMVLQRIAPSLQVADLGVLVRPGRPEPSADQTVLPAAFFATAAPTKVNGYRFAFKPCCDANVTCSLYAEGSERALATQVFRRTPGGRPFTWRLDANALAPGAYRLVLVGYLIETNKRIRQVVRFRHRPNLQ
jgi:hypothetical protein